MKKHICSGTALLAAALFGIAAPPTPAAAGPVLRTSAEAGTTYGGPLVGIDWARPVASGDLDGDGYDEIIVSASESWGSVFSHVYIVRGGPGAHGRGTVDLGAQPADQVITGAQLDDNLGASVATGDVNNDGIDDLLLCASLADYGGLSDRGIAYLIYGGAAFFASATRDLALAGTWDVRILGPVAAGDMGGANAFGGLDCQGAAIGHLDADVYGDIALGVHLADGGGNDAGRAYIVWGGPYPSGSTVNLQTGGGVRIDGKATFDELGTMVCTADLTGDGLDELILGVEYASKTLFSSDGAVYVFRGRARASWPTLWALNATAADITLLGARGDDNLGASVAVGDFNDDGIADLAAAAPGAELGPLDDQLGDGLIYGLLGSAAYQTGTYSRDYARSQPDFLLIGDPDESLGSLVTAGDFNLDGVADIAAGEWFGGPATNGVVEVLYGRAFAAAETFTAGVNTDLRITGAPNDRISFSLGSADVNGDGLDEIVFGTPFNNGERGTVYVFTYVSGDADGDGDVDVHDAAAFQTCCDAPPPGGLAIGCIELDFTLDEAVDGDDFPAWCEQMAGPGL